MGLPSINIVFSEAASTLEARAARGVVAAILTDSTTSVQGSHVLADAVDIPAAMTATNKTYLEQIFIGADSKPSKVLCYVLPDTAEDFSEATDWLSRQVFNWLVGPPDIDEDGVAELTDWIAAQRANGRKYKAVLPNAQANDCAIVNFTADNIVAGKETYSTAQYCGRVAGLIAGTPLNSSVTYAPLPEVMSVEDLSRAALDKAIDDGELVLFHDGRKVKIGRGVTSLASGGKSDIYKKIKVVATLDLISEDITTLAADTYIGKYYNSYDNKLLLITAIKGYFLTLEADGVLKPGSSVELDIASTLSWLKAAGVDTSTMTEQEIKEADTGDAVFIIARIHIYDAIEDIILRIMI